ncbi:MAG: hypothetical protein PHP92_03260 [Candidatus Nanoarchaeia archaeon]|nr:hypothetical protein [Candidatus Nanoarchaeia archaeon]
MKDLKSKILKEMVSDLSTEEKKLGDEIFSTLCLSNLKPKFSNKTEGQLKLYIEKRILEEREK